MLNASQLDQIHALTKQVLSTKADDQPALYGRMDAIMNPVLKAAEAAPIAEVEAVIQKLPLGYYRQSLRVAVIERTHPAK